MLLLNPKRQNSHFQAPMKPANATLNVAKTPSHFMVLNFVSYVQVVLTIKQKGHIVVQSSARAPWIVVRLPKNKLKRVFSTPFLLFGWSCNKKHFSITLNRSKSIYINHLWTVSNCFPQQYNYPVAQKTAVIIWSRKMDIADAAFWAVLRFGW